MDDFKTRDLPYTYEIYLEGMESVILTDTEHETAGSFRDRLDDMARSGSSFVTITESETRESLVVQLDKIILISPVIEGEGPDGGTPLEGGEVHESVKLTSVA